MSFPIARLGARRTFYVGLKLTVQDEELQTSTETTSFEGCRGLARRDALKMWINAVTSHVNRHNAAGQKGWAGAKRSVPDPGPGELYELMSDLGEYWHYW